MGAVVSFKPTASLTPDIRRPFAGDLARWDGVTAPPPLKAIVSEISKVGGKAAVLEGGVAGLSFVGTAVILNKPVFLRTPMNADGLFGTYSHPAKDPVPSLGYRITEQQAAALRSTGHDLWLGPDSPDHWERTLTVPDLTSEPGYQAVPTWSKILTAWRKKYPDAPGLPVGVVVPMLGERLVQVARQYGDWFKQVTPPARITFLTDMPITAHHNVMHMAPLGDMPWLVSARAHMSVGQNWPVMDSRGCAQYKRIMSITVATGPAGVTIADTALEAVGSVVARRQCQSCWS